MRVFSVRAAIAVAAVVLAAGILVGGSALRPAIAAGTITPIHPDALVTCASSGACEIYDNTSSGPGLKGESGTGTGLYGDATKGGTGMLAESEAGIGLRALSNSSTEPAIKAESGGGGNIFEGANSSGTVVVTITPYGGVSTTNFSVQPNGDISGNGFFTSLGNLHVTGESAALDIVSGGDSGVASVGGSFDGEDAGIIGTNMARLTSGTGTGYAVEAVGFGGDLFVAENTHHVHSLDASDNGNLTITGQLYTAGSCSTGCVKRADEPGVHVIRYTPSESQPTIEDFGEGQVTNGSGYVHFDATFASTIDQAANYMVFITPEGPSSGVYVAQKSANGFAVVENPGGHSTFAFSWRIIATPYGDTQARLPMVNMAANGRSPRPSGNGH